MEAKWKREAAGVYTADAKNGHWLIERGWGDEPATDRRRQTWTVSFVHEGVMDILVDCVSLTEAKRAVAGEWWLGRDRLPKKEIA